MKTKILQFTNGVLEMPDAFTLNSITVSGQRVDFETPIIVPKGSRLVIESDNPAVYVSIEPDPPT